MERSQARRNRVKRSTERIRRTALVLDSLDDRTLSDIGLRRAQILSAAVHTVDGRDADRWRTWI